jgi:hypothetical protein
MGISSHLLLANLTPKIINFRFNAFVSGSVRKVSEQTVSSDYMAFACSKMM